MKRSQDGAPSITQMSQIIITTDTVELKHALRNKRKVTKQTDSRSSPLQTLIINSLRQINEMRMNEEATLIKGE